MRHPWANLALLVLLAAELLTGFFGLASGWDGRGWILWLHAGAAYALVLLLFWKGQIIVDVLARRRRVNGLNIAFLLMTGLTLLILGVGFLWSYAGPRYWLGFSLMTLHALLGSALAVLAAWHTLARRFILRVGRARDRRAFLRLASVSLGAAALWAVARPAKAALGLPGAGTRFTGSYRAGAPGQFPTVSWLFDNPAPIATSGWRLEIRGTVERPLTLSYEQLQALAADRLTATLDCTGGWYSAQQWTGVYLGRLLDMCGVGPAARSVSVQSVSGYYRRFDLAEAAGLLLATAVGSGSLDHGHGFPLRLVAPGHRGFEWVKWVTRIEVDDTSHLLQPPLPLQ